MSVSLLDVLSCGLAVVVILLVISLNTGTGFTNDEKLTTAEVTIHGSMNAQSMFSIQWNEKNEQCNFKPVSSRVFTLEGSSIIDTLKSFFQTNIYFPERDSTYIDGSIFFSSKKMDFLFHPKCQGMVIKYPFSFFGGNGGITARLTNVSDRKGYNMERTTLLAAGSYTLEISYKGGVRVRIYDSSGDKLNFFLKNTR